MWATVGEAEARPGDQILDCAGNQHLARRGKCGDPSSKRNRETGDLAIQQLALARMQPGPNF